MRRNPSVTLRHPWGKTLPRYPKKSDVIVSAGAPGACTGVTIPAQTASNARRRICATPATPKGNTSCVQNAPCATPSVGTSAGRTAESCPNPLMSATAVLQSLTAPLRRASMTQKPQIGRTVSCCPRAGQGYPSPRKSCNTLTA